MILGKLFLTFTFTLVIGLLVTWFWQRTPNTDKLDKAIVTGSATTVLVSSIGFVITGILWIWF